MSNRNKQICQICEERCLGDCVCDFMDYNKRIAELEAQLAAAHTLIHQIEDEIKFTGSEIHVRKSINNYRAALNGEDDAAHN